MHICREKCFEWDRRWCTSLCLHGCVVFECLCMNIRVWICRYAHVQFASPGEAAAAVALNGSQVLGTAVQCRFATPFAPQPKRESEERAAKKRAKFAEKQAAKGSSAGSRGRGGASPSRGGTLTVSQPLNLSASPLCDGCKQCVPPHLFLNPYLSPPPTAFDRRPWRLSTWWWQRGARRGGRLQWRRRCVREWRIVQSFHKLCPAATASTFVLS